MERTPDMAETARPVLRLKPKADGRRVRRGAPWVYLSDIVADRRSRAIPPGAVATLEDSERVPLATVAVNMGSKIAARVLDFDPDAVVDAAWIEARLAAAAAHRARLYDAPFYRLVHAEADGLPGIVVDRFGDVAVLQPNAAWAAEREDWIADALVRLGMPCVLRNASGRARGLEGLDEAGAVLRGALPEAPLPVAMNGATYLADVTGGQKTGLFYDQRPNHAMAARLARGAVLDVFSHVGGFALAMLAGRAETAVCVDGSAAALDLLRGGAEASGVAGRIETRRGDAFATMAALAAEGARFDTVVCDPPAFAPTRAALEAGLRGYEKVALLAAPLVEPGGYLVLCSCSHAVDLAAFRTACLRGLGRARRRGRIVHTGSAGPDHPVHPHLAESGYLKALFLRLD